MNNEQKKEYVKPELTVVKTVHKVILLGGSCVGEGCAHGEWKD